MYHTARSCVVHHPPPIPRLFGAFQSKVNGMHSARLVQRRYPIEKVPCPAISTLIHTYYTYTYIYIHTYIYIYMYIFVCMYLCIYIHTYIHMYIYIGVHMYRHNYIRTYVHTYIRIYVYTYIHTYIYLSNTHTHTHARARTRARARTHTHTYIHRYKHTCWVVSKVVREIADPQLAHTCGWQQHRERRWRQAGIVRGEVPSVVLHLTREAARYVKHLLRLYSGSVKALLRLATLRATAST